MLMKKFALILTLILIALCAAAPSNAATQASASVAEAVEDNRPELRWGGDSEGGFPYMFPSPVNPDKLIGFEVDIENLSGKRFLSQQRTAADRDSLIQHLAQDRGPGAAAQYAGI